MLFFQDPHYWQIKIPGCTFTPKSKTLFQDSEFSPQFFLLQFCSMLYTDLPDLLPEPRWSLFLSSFTPKFFRIHVAAPEWALPPV